MSTMKPTKDTLLVDGLAVLITLLAMLAALPQVTTTSYGGAAIGLFGIVLPSWVGWLAGLAAFVLFRALVRYIRQLPPNEAADDLGNLNQVFGRVGELLDLAGAFGNTNDSGALTVAKKLTELLPQETAAALAGADKPVESPPVVISTPGAIVLPSLESLQAIETPMATGVSAAAVGPVATILSTLLLVGALLLPTVALATSNYPSGIDTTASTLPQPGPNDPTTSAGNLGHAQLHDNENDAIRALQTYIGVNSIGQTSPTAVNSILMATSVGTSQWTTSPTVGSATVTSDPGLTFSTANSRIVPGASSISIRDNANTNDNLRVQNNGAVTVRFGLTVSAQGETISAGGLAFGDAASQIIPGATSMSLRNSANNADNFICVDAGSCTARSGLTTTTGGVTVTAGGLTVSNNGSSIAGSTGNGLDGSSLTLNSSLTGALTLLNISGSVTASGNSQSLRGILVAPTLLTGGNSSDTFVGIDVSSVSGGANNFAIRTSSGLVKLGDELQTVASSTSRAGLNLASGTAPSSPVDGDMWYDGTNLKVRLNGSTKTVTVS